MIRALLGPLLLGVATGARASLGPAGAAFAPPRPGSSAPVRAIQSRSGRSVATVLVVGELIGDKLPQAPSRLEPQSLAARLVSGALGGAGLSRRGAVAVSLGATAGAAGALVGSFGGARARAHGAQKRWPDWPTAVAEDVLALALTWTAGRSSP